MEREGYKMTELGEIPEEWEVRKLGEICSNVFVGIATSTTEYYTNHGVPIVRNLNIKEDYLDSNDILMITREFSEKNKNKRLKEGDVLTVRTGYPGISCVVEKEFEDAQTFTTLVSRPNQAHINPYFLSRYLNSELGRRFIRGGQAGGAQQNLNVSSLVKIPICLPPLQEQKQIASILSTADEAISKTEEIIEKTKKTKKGLMQQLLSKGIGHREFKQTELGEIPVEWEVRKIDDISVFVGSGVTPKGGQDVYKTKGIPFIRSQNVYPNRIVLVNVAYIDEKQHENMKRTEFKENDVLLNITGASIGRCTYVPIGFGIGNVNQHVCIIRSAETVDPQYLSGFINSMEGQEQIFSFQNGSSREGLNFKQVRAIKIPLPPLEEQKAIASILSSVDEKIEALEKRKAQLERTKKGLMQDLLTGKVRVSLES